MEITEVRIKLMDEPSERLQAFCSITFDDAFVVRDLKIIEGNKGPFVAMPSRKLTDRCPRCRAKNHLRAQNCNSCGLRLPDDRAPKDHEGRARLHADIAHPINAASREMIQKHVLEAFQQELQRSKEPGYVSNYDDDYPDDGFEAEFDEAETPSYGRMISRVDSTKDASQGPHRRSPERQRQPLPATAPKSAKAPGTSEGFGAGIL